MIDTNKARELAQRCARLQNLYALDELTEAAALLTQLADAHNRHVAALTTIRDATHTNAVTLRGIADYALKGS